MLNKQTPRLTSTVNKGAEQKRHRNYSTSSPETHPAYLKLQRNLAGMSHLHQYSDSRPGGALIKCLMIYLIKSPDCRACRAKTLKNIAQKTGFTHADSRNALHWLIRGNIVRQLATNDASITLALTDGGGEYDY